MPGQPKPSDLPAAAANELQPVQVDAHVGARIRLRRLMLGLTQAEVATEVEISQQHLQQHERGVSRVSAARLYALARVLGVPVGYFFEELEGTRADAGGGAPSDGSSDQEALAVMRAYNRIVDPDDRKAMLDLLRRFGSRSA